MKVIFCGGGTAGHVYPAIAMAELIERNQRGNQFLFVGREGGEENNAVVRAGYALEQLDVIGLGKIWSLKNAAALYKAIRAIGSAKRIIRDFKPDVVIGTGGYVCFPTLMAASQLKIPTLIHESNAVPGLVTRLLAGRCDAVMLGFASCESHLPKCAKIKVTGNPVRVGFKRIDKREARRRLGIGQMDFVVLSFGGSLGAEALNNAIAECAREYKSRGVSINHIHASGRRYYDEFLSNHPELNRDNSFRLLPYIDDMPLYLSAADLAVTRAGAITTSELIETATPSILIPSPNVSENHQYKNAMAIRELGGAMVITEEELNGTLLTDRILELKSSRDSREAMARALRRTRDEATGESILKVIREVIA